jgi:hypothetical protein
MSWSRSSRSRLRRREQGKKRERHDLMKTTKETTKKREVDEKTIERVRQVAHAEVSMDNSQESWKGIPGWLREVIVKTPILVEEILEWALAQRVPLERTLEHAEKGSGVAALDVGDVSGVRDEVDPDGGGVAAGYGDPGDVGDIDPAFPLRIVGGDALRVEGVEKVCEFHEVVSFVDKVRREEIGRFEAEWKDCFGGDLRRFESFKKWLGFGREFQTFPKVRVTCPRAEVKFELVW